MEQNKSFSDGKNSQGDLWYVDNYVLLKDYYDRTISRIAARCVRKGNIAMEEYPFYGYILDVLEEISETGDYIVAHPDLYSYVEKKIAGGINALKKNLNEYKTELKNNASPEMIKQDKDELDKMKEALGAIDKSVDPTVGAGMSMDEVVEKLLNENKQTSTQPSSSQSVSQPLQQKPQTQQSAVPQNKNQQQPQKPSGTPLQQPQNPSQTPVNNGSN